MSKTPRLTTVNALRYVSSLFQLNEISESERDKLVSLLKKGMKSEDFTDFIRAMYSMRERIRTKTLIDMCIDEVIN